MKASELVSILQRLITERGDLSVWVERQHEFDDGGRLIFPKESESGATRIDYLPAAVSYPPRFNISDRHI